MIDSQEYELGTKDDRDTAVEFVIQENNLTCWGGLWNKRTRVTYPKSQLLAQFTQLIKFLKDGVPETKPKSEIIWSSGSSVIKPDYLKKHLLYDIDATSDANVEQIWSRTVDSEEAPVMPEACTYVETIAYT